MDRLGHAHAALEHAHAHAAQQVDGHDQHAGHGVALDELGCTVHGAVEVGLARDLLAPAAGLLVGDLAGVQVGVDRHLLARHAVEGEPRGDLGHAAGAVRDDDELDDDEDQEDDEADDEVAAGDERAERVDDAARVRVQEDQPRHADVDREPEQRRQEQERREGREVERPRHVHRHDQDRQRRRDVHRDDEVDERRRERHDHHHDDDDDRERGGEIGVLQEAREHASAHPRGGVAARGTPAAEHAAR